jgi:hypothetical protein
VARPAAWRVARRLVEPDPMPCPMGWVMWVLTPVTNMLLHSVADEINLQDQSMLRENKPMGSWSNPNR